MKTGECAGRAGACEPKPVWHDHEQRRVIGEADLAVQERGVGLRHAEQIRHRPEVGLLTDDGHVQGHPP